MVSEQLQAVIMFLETHQAGERIIKKNHCIMLLGLYDSGILLMRYPIGIIILILILLIRMNMGTRYYVSLINLQIRKETSVNSVWTDVMKSWKKWVLTLLTMMECRMSLTMYTPAVVMSVALRWETTRRHLRQIITCKCGM